MKKINFLGVLTLLLCFSTVVDAQLAFPTARGFGKLATGGRGGQVAEVTNLEDYAEGEDEIPGSLRWALDQYPNEPLTVVFRTSGTIMLKRNLRKNRADFTIAGQTAPGDGICIKGNKINFGGSSNFILRHIRSRVGQYDINGEILAENSFGAENCQNFIIDHCTFGWSVEENMNTFDDKFHTVQWCIIHEGLYDAGHSKGVRGYGMQWGGSQATYHHNLLAHNKSRSCRFNGARGSAFGQDLIVYLEYINNVNYNWGSENACYGGENTAENAKNFGHDGNFLNNYYKPGPATASKHYFFNQSYAREGAESMAAHHGPSQWHFSGNVMHGDASVTENNWLGFKNGTSFPDGSFKVDTIIQPVKFLSGYTYDWATYTYDDYETAENAYESVLESAGAFPRDGIDSRIVNEVKTGTAAYGNNGIINTPQDAEGYLNYNTYDEIVDADHDGMDDAWETENGLDPTNSEDRNLLTTDGYTALEVYMNNLVGEYIEPVFTTDIRISKAKSFNVNVICEPGSNVITILSENILKEAQLYSIDGVMLLRQNLDSSNELYINSLLKGSYVLIIVGEDGNIEKMKITKI